VVHHLHTVRPATQLGVTQPFNIAPPQWLHVLSQWLGHMFIV
jgi:hypothetical protein